jgi:multidrug efflux pump subunit AcrB
MSSRDPQPGDHAPTDHTRPGDLARLHGADDTAGDRAPIDPSPTLKEELADEAGPMEGVNFSAPFIKRPVATFLLSAAVIIAGSVAYKLLPVASLPQVEFPTISVNASLPGADPDTMASAVATPLERQFSRIAGVNQMTSSSGVGTTGITLQFDLNRDVNGAARDVQAAINAARAQLPANMPSNPTYRKANPSDIPILIMALTSDTATVAQMYDVSDSILAQKISQMQGVGQVQTGGSAKPAVRLEVNPNLLTSTGLGLESVRAAIGTVNVSQPTGYINGPDQRIQISTTDQLFGAAAYAPLIIATNHGSVSSASASTGLPTAEASAISNATATAGPASNFATSSIKTTGAANEHGIVRVQDVANVVNSVEDIHTGGFLDKRHAIVIQVFKAPGANVIETVDSILAILPRLQASIPPTIKLQVVLDRTLTIRASVKQVTNTLAISIVLVILVVFFFLREIRSTLIPSVSVPLSLLGTFGVMYLLGYTLDNLSLMALTISTGFVVDDAIVVIENISRHLEAGLSPFLAAMKGAREIGFTVVSMSTSLVAVFIPILLMGGIIGLLFREFAVTLSVAIGISLVVSLTATPMLSAKFLKPHDAIRKGWFYRTGERGIAALTAEYARGLRWVLRHQGITLAVFLLTFALNIYLYIIVPKGFFPQQDAGRLRGEIRAQQDTSFASMEQKMQQILAVIDKDPGVQAAVSFVGGGGGANQAGAFVFLKPIDQRMKTGDTADVILNRLRPATSHFPGVTLYLQNVQELGFGARSAATQYQYTLTADTVADLDEWSPRLMDAMRNLPQLKDVATDQQNKGLEEDLVIDRDTASRLGVSPLAIDSTLSDAFSQRQISTTYQALNQYHVVMEVAQQFQNDPTALQKIFVKSTTGAEIPLSAVTHLATSRIPLTVNHQSLSPAATLSFNLSPGFSLSDATAAVENARQQIGMPTTVHGGFQGTAQAYQSSLSSQPILILLAIVTVYIVLGILYESFIHPLTILSTLPSAGVGALIALILFKVELSIIAMIGILLLIGIVKKNAILMIDFALVAERQHGKTPREAIYEACLLRFRPIMMTTMAALLGGVPLALGTGTGAELRRPLGISIVGGLIVSQCLTLFTTPVVYLFFDRLRQALPRWRGMAVDALGLRRPARPQHHPAD